MAERGAIAASQHRRPASPFHADDPMAHRVHPAVDRVETSSARTAVDRRRLESQRAQLSACDHPALTVGDGRDPLIRDEFASHTDV